MEAFCLLCSTKTPVPENNKLCTYHKRFYRLCKRCGQVMCRVATARAAASPMFCSSCIVEHAGFCDDCGELIAKGEGKIISMPRHTVGPKHLCLKCQKERLPLKFTELEIRPTVMWDEATT